MLYPESDAFKQYTATGNLEQNQVFYHIRLKSWREFCILLKRIFQKRFCTNKRHCTPLPKMPNTANPGAGTLWLPAGLTSVWLEGWVGKVTEQAVCRSEWAIAHECWCWGSFKWKTQADTKVTGPPQVSFCDLKMPQIRLLRPFCFWRYW